MLTFRLADSLPAEKLRAMQGELKRINDVERRKLLERHLDAGYGACLLAHPDVASIVEETLLHFDSERYRLFAWVVMPNHVHALIETIPEFSLSSILHSWKGYTANQINKLLNRGGPLWQPEYFDRFVRDESHFANAVNYIHMNPVKVNLCPVPEAWRFSSASRP